ncbi:MAG: SET domain-containing protein-lysine N-methyltransferase [Candidatus Zixiibacteriota bacterium]|nr:MAG: SET domain-containing protein-lysine N-methyltransferase [candidate division Zixibacteria bacterium]
MARNGKRPNRLYTIKRSGIQGRGVFAARRIRKGRRIIEYKGERINEKEEEERYDESKMDRHHTYLFMVDDKISIDGNSKGNSARLINHSCDPNCEAVDEEGRIFIEAIRNIQPGVELTYDYNFEVDEPITRRDLEFYACRCGSEKCRGTILNPKNSRKSKGNGSGR